MSDTVTLRVNGQDFSGWTTATVTRGIESLVGAFDLELVEKWAERSAPWPVREGNRCEVLVNGETVVTGYVDTFEAELGYGQHRVRVTGRDIACDVVDCSAELEQWEFTGVDPLTIARQLCAPFGVNVRLQAGLVLPASALPKKFAVDPGDTVASVLETLCRLCGVLAMSDGRGGVLLTRAGREPIPTALVEGQNLLSVAASFSRKERFGRYVCLGSNRGSDAVNGAALKIRAEASDAEVRESRVLIVRPETPVSIAQARARAQWEAAVRAARGDVVTGRVAGWTQRGRVWPVNSIVSVRAPSVHVSGRMLISSATYSVGRDGTITTLELKRPGAFVPVPTVRASGGGDRYWKEIERGV